MTLRPREKALIIVLASGGLWALIMAVAREAQQGVAFLLAGLGLPQ